MQPEDVYFVIADAETLNFFNRKAHTNSKPNDKISNAYCTPARMNFSKLLVLCEKNEVMEQLWGCL